MEIDSLGLVDDIIAVSEASHRAQMINTILNLKSAEKGVQFGVNKCKVMIIGRELENVINYPIYADEWTESYFENEVTGDIEIKEKYEGKIAIEEVKEQKYLGFVLNSQGNNLANIQALEKKSYGVISFRKGESNLFHLHPSYEKIFYEKRQMTVKYFTQVRNF